MISLVVTGPLWTIPAAPATKALLRVQLCRASIIRNNRPQLQPVAPTRDSSRSDRRLNLQPLLAHSRIGGEFGRRAFEHDAAVAHHVEPAGNLQRDGQLLLHQ